MKVLKENPVPTKTITCTNCGSELEYGNADLREDYSRRSDNGIYTQINANTGKSWLLRCPVCGVEFPASWIHK